MELPSSCVVGEAKRAAIAALAGSNGVLHGARETVRSDDELVVVKPWGGLGPAALELQVRCKPTVKIAILKV